MPRRRNASTRLAADLVQLSVAAPQVVATRLAGIAAAGATPSAQDRAELVRMTAEKAAAFQASWWGMWGEAMRSQAALAQAWSTAMLLPLSPGRTHDAARASMNVAARVLGAGVAPVRRKAVANAKRLARRSRR